ncbi:MAG TPA: acyl-CoA carboxylase subunit epsilon [Streptosporangiaceae bacterium]
MFLRVVRGVPTAEELVALVTVLLAEEDSPAVSSRPGRSPWSDPARLLRGPAARGSLDRGPNAWRRSAGPI